MSQDTPLVLIIAACCLSFLLGWGGAIFRAKRLLKKAQARLRYHGDEAGEEIIDKLLWNMGER